MASSQPAPGASAGQFIVLRDRRRSKPFSREELERLVRAGRVRGTDGLRELRDGAWTDVGVVGDQGWLAAAAERPAQEAMSAGASAAPALVMRFPAWRIATALVLSVAVDALNLVFALVPPVYIAVDIVAAVAIWLALGRPMLLLSILLVEAVPGVGMIPFWTIVVGLIILTGSIPARGMTEIEERGPVGRAVALIASKLQPSGGSGATSAKRKR